MLSQYKLKDYNFILILLVAALSVIGIMLVGSADQSLRSRQMYGAIAGAAIMIVISLFDYSWILNFTRILYVVNLGFLVIVLLTGDARKGASRWLQIGSFQFQPTELAKILLILFFAMYFMKNEESINTPGSILKSVLLLLPPLALIAMQPDLKNTITITLIFFLLIYVAGLSYRRIGTILLIIIPAAAIFLLLVTQTNLPIIKEYQKNRIMTFFEGDEEEYSESAIQQRNSITAIGSGQLTGKGLNNNEVSSSNRGNFVAELQNDFIFAVAGEELGFIGCFIIILLLFLIVLQCLLTGRKAKDLSGTLICSGVASMIAIQSFINICVATGLFPNTGTPLPFVSYGLTSLFCMYMGIGFVLNVGLQNRNYYMIWER
ncbi:MAG: FtsW/RodA/SpoVE family cell cycle protein [Eubacterium sp.]|nr:FtsW/RodA/SpoVE family cell cycle protein [Eubacterium sp.]